MEEPAGMQAASTRRGKGERRQGARVDGDPGEHEAAAENVGGKGRVGGVEILRGDEQLLGPALGMAPTQQGRRRQARYRLAGLAAGEETEQSQPVFEWHPVHGGYLRPHATPFQFE